MREPLGHPSGQAVAAHEPVHRDGGEGERLLIAVAAEAHEQRLLVEQPDAAGERMDRSPRLERLLDGLGDGDLALTAALPAHVEAVVAGVGARAAQVPGAQAAQLGRAQPAVAQDAQQRVVALAGDRAPVGDAQEVGVVGVGQRLRRPGLVPGHAYGVDSLVQTELPGERADHRQIYAHGRRRRRAAAATTGRGQVPAIGGDDVGVEIANHWRAAQLAGQPVPEGAEDRPVLPPRTRRRRAGGDPLGLAEQVALLRARERQAAGRGRGCWPTRPHRRSSPARRRRARARPRRPG